MIIGKTDSKKAITIMHTHTYGIEPEAHVPASPLNKVLRIGINLP